jgi:hypothetical protein
MDFNPELCPFDFGSVSFFDIYLQTVIQVVSQCRLAFERPRWPRTVVTV